MTSNGSNPSAPVANGNPVSIRNPSPSVATLVVPQALQKHLSSRHCKNWRIAPSGVVSLHHSNLNETNPQTLSHEEHRAIFGHGGLVSKLCPVWKKGRNDATRNRSFQSVVTCHCLCVNCPYKLKVLRIPGGLVVLEKQQSVNGILSPVTHNQHAHDHIPSFSTRGHIGRQSTLSHTQKEFIVKHGRLNRNRENSQMLFLTI